MQTTIIFRACAIAAVLLLSPQSVCAQSADQLIAKGDLADVSFRAADALNSYHAAEKLNPRNDTAWHILGRWHQSLANISGAKRALGGAIYGKLPTGTNAESIDCFEKAIAINPRRLRHYIEEGRTYAQMGDKVTARRFINKGLAMPDKEKDDPEIKARGRETLANM